MKAILRKLGARNRTEAAVWARSHGLAPQCQLDGATGQAQPTSSAVGVAASFGGRSLLASGEVERITVAELSAPPDATPALGPGPTYKTPPAR